MNKQNRKKLIQRRNGWLTDGRGLGKMGEKGEGIKKYKLAVTN